MKTQALMDSLIIFLKNPEKGKVKTRLAATVGDDIALDIYEQLLKYTSNVMQQVKCEKYIYHSGGMISNDLFQKAPYQKRSQKGNDLGERMLNAFKDVKLNGSEKIIIIGTDCPGITPDIIQNAFTDLDENDIVIGPAIDGGYYLLGMKNIYDVLFKDIAWSSSMVFKETMDKATALNLEIKLLPTLNDIDIEEDLYSAVRSLVD